MSGEAAIGEVSASLLERLTIKELFDDKRFNELETLQAELSQPVQKRNRVFNWITGLTIGGLVVGTAVYRISEALGYETVARIADDLSLPTILGGASAMALSFIYNQTGRRKREERTLEAVNNKLAEYYDNW